jgi:hypothetical protein
MQNTQFAFSICGDCIDISNIISNVKQLDAHMCAPISPNINWHNTGITRVHEPFKKKNPPGTLISRLIKHWFT